MSGLFGGHKNNSTTAPIIASLQYQTSQYGAVIPVVHGRVRVPANVVDYTDWTPIPHTTTTSSGKGGGGSQNYNTTYTYTANVILGICCGPILQYYYVQRDKEVDSVSTWPYTTFLGDASQAPWSVMVSKHPERAVGYGGLAYACQAAMDLGGSATIKNHSFVLVGNPSTLSPGGGLQEANGALVIQDMLTNPDNGMGWPSSLIDSASILDSMTYTEAAFLQVCCSFQEAKAGAQHLQEVMDSCNLTVIWSGGKLKLKPLGDTNLGPNAGAPSGWTAPSTPIYSFTNDDYIVSNPDEDPITMKVRPLADSPNRIQVEFANITNNFQPEVAEAEDLGDIDRFWERTASTRKLSMVPTPDRARSVAQLILQRGLYIRRTYEFQVGWPYALLEPMDLVEISDTSMGLVNLPVRIIDLEEDEEGLIKITAEEWPFGVATAMAYHNPGGRGASVNQNASPGSVQGYFLFEPPLDLTNGERQIWVAAYGGSNWGGCGIHVSRDGSSYQQIGEIRSKARLGAITASLPSSTVTNDTIHVLSVNIAGSGGTLLGASNLDVNNYETLSLVGNSGLYELISYRDANLTSLGHYDLSGILKRSLYGTGSNGHNSHAAGVTFLRLDDNVARVVLDRWDSGTTIYFKLTSFNTFRNAMETLDVVTAIPYTISAGAPTWPPTSGTTIGISPTRPV